MVAQTAVEYVRTQLNAGIKPEDVKKAMKKAGWKEKDIEEAMAEATGARRVVEERVETRMPRMKAPRDRDVDSDIFSASFAIGRLLPAETAEDITATLDELAQIAEKKGFEKFSGLIEGLRLTVEGQDYETSRYEVSRVAEKIKKVFEEELSKK